NELANLAGAVADIAAERSADRTEDADERFQTSQGVTGSLRDQRRQGRSRSCSDDLALDGDLREGRLTQAQDNALDALIVDQQVAAVAQDAQRQALLETM